MWKEADVSFEVVFGLLHGSNRENNKNLGSSDQSLKLGPSEKEVTMLEQDMKLQVP
jgi:hypothetical protein